MNKTVEIAELEIGDEIITLTQQPKYLKILEKPRLSHLKNWRGNDRYIAVKCRVKVNIVQKPSTKYNYTTKTYVPTTYDDKTYFIEAPSDEDAIEKFDLNYKKLWLVKRKNYE